MIECIIFDMDGTLVDSERLMMRGLSDLIAEIDVSNEELTRRYGGQHLSKTFLDVEEAFNCKLPDNFETIYRQHVATLIDADLQTFDGVYEALDGIKVPIGLATNAPMQKANQIMRTANLGGYFGDKLFSAYQIGSWKPEPDLFLHAAETLGFKPYQCLVVEDSINGIQAGLAAGMRVLQFCNTHNEPLHDNYFRTYSEFPSIVSTI